MQIHTLVKTIQNDPVPLFVRQTIVNLITTTLYIVITDIIVFNNCHREQVTAATMAASADLPEINAPELSPIDDIDGGTAAYLDAPDDDLDAELMSDFSKLQIDSSDCPRTFSPIGSERTSPEQGLQ